MKEFQKGIDGWEAKKPDSLYTPLVSRGERIGHDSCPVGNELDTIRVRHEADSTFGRIRNRDTNPPSNRTRNPTNRDFRTRTPKNRTRNPRKETVRFT